MNGSITAVIDWNEGELELCVKYEYDRETGLAEVTGAHLTSEPLGWSYCTTSDEWKRWDYSEHVDNEYMQLACEEDARERIDRDEDRRAAEMEDAFDANREYARMDR